MISVPDVLADLFSYLGIPKPAALPMMKLEYQVAQKLHGATERGSKRAHDLIDLQLILSQEKIDMTKTAAVCRELFRYRRKQPWPTFVAKNENWDAAYADQKGDLKVLSTVDEAVEWANELIAEIDKS